MNEMLNKNKQPLHDDIIYVEGEENGISLEVAMQYNDSYNSSIYNDLHLYSSNYIIHILLLCFRKITIL